MSQVPETSQSRWQLPDFSRPEIRTAILLCLYYFLVMCAFTVLKPVRNAILLDRLGKAWLPVAFMGLPIITGLAVYSAGWFAARIPDRNRVLATTITLILNLLLFRWLFEMGRGSEGAGATAEVSLEALKTGWVALLFYLWANLFASILITQFWLVAGNQFTPRDAKRLVGWVSAGGLVGGIAGPTIVLNVVDHGTRQKRKRPALSGEMS